MTRFNTQEMTQLNPRKTTNFEGEVAYDINDPLLRLFIAASTGTLTARFYEEAGSGIKPMRGKRRAYSYDAPRFYNPSFDPMKGAGPNPTAEDELKATKHRVKELEDLCSKLKPWEVVNVAKVVRDDMYLRTAPIVLLGILAKQRRLKREYIPYVLKRADEPLELAAVWQFLSGNSNLKRLPNALKKGLADAQIKLLNAYTARKYSGKAITQKDLMRLTHPAPKDAAQNEVFRMINEDSLPVIGTWETRISAAGPDPDAKRKAWEVWVDEDMTYMAALRNLRNLIEANISPERFGKVCDLIGNEQAASRAMQFPFDYFTAYRMLLGDKSEVRHLPVDWKRLAEALERGVKASAASIPGWDYLKDKRVCIAADFSGSMQQPKSYRSVVELFHIATILGYLMQAHLPFTTIGMFGDRWETLPSTPNILQGSLDAYKMAGRVGYSTQGNKVFEWAIKENLSYDLFCFFSDMQIYGDLNAIRRKGRSAFETAFDEYKSRVNPNARMILFSLCGYSTLPIDVVREDIYLISGWSDKVFQIIGSLDSGQDPLAKLRLPL
jgi:60 kDa SS-A/Ro ribonucleoprotein